MNRPSFGDPGKHGRTRQDPGRSPSSATTRYSSATRCASSRRPGSRRLPGRWMKPRRWMTRPHPAALRDGPHGHRDFPSSTAVPAAASSTPSSPSRRFRQSTLRSESSSTCRIRSASTLSCAAATEAQKQSYLPRLATDTIASYALSEASSGSDAFALQTRATRQGEDYVLNGQKLWITNALESGLSSGLRDHRSSARLQGNHRVSGRKRHAPASRWARKRRSWASAPPRPHRCCFRIVSSPRRRSLDSRGRATRSPSRRSMRGALASRPR